MKPEHAQEIYDIISNLDDLANSHCIGDRDKIDEAVERARELLDFNQEKRKHSPEKLLASVKTVLEWSEFEDLYCECGRAHKMSDCDYVWMLKKALERPDVPEPGTIVEYVIATNDDVYRVGWVNGRTQAGLLIANYRHSNTLKYKCNDIAAQWRYQGEKEWRE